MAEHEESLLEERVAADGLEHPLPPDLANVVEERGRVLALSSVPEDDKDEDVVYQHPWDVEGGHGGPDEVEMGDRLAAALWADDDLLARVPTQAVRQEHRADMDEGRNHVLQTVED